MEHDGKKESVENEGKKGKSGTREKKSKEWSMSEGKERMEDVI